MVQTNLSPDNPGKGKLLKTNLSKYKKLLANLRINNLFSCNIIGQMAKICLEEGLSPLEELEAGWHIGYCL